MEFVRAFIVGGILCAIGQVVIDKTNFTPAKLLVTYVVSGVVLTSAGTYKPLVDWAGAGATVPLTGFGYALATGVQKAVEQNGFLGILTGGIVATAAGVTVAIVLGFFLSLVAKSNDKA